MNIGTLRLPLILGGVLGVIAVARVGAWPLARIRLPSSPASGLRSHASSETGRTSAESVAVIVSRDPFRLGHRPVIPAYDPLRVAEQLAPPPQRPVLILAGVIDGAEPSAVIEGLPGVEGSRVMRVGDVVSGLQIKRISGGRVVIAGLDTTWVLEVREPWRN